MESNSLMCPICGSSSSQILKYKVQGTHPARLNECRNCKFLFVDNHYWLDSSFTSELNSLDIGALDRSLVLSDFLEVLIRSMKLKNGRFLDWGGGYGVLTRLMREKGLNFHNYDPYVTPLFSNPANTKQLENYDLISMGEVALHLSNPTETFRSLLKHTDVVLFTAVIAPNVVPDDWWYLMPDTGQHVAIFRESTIRELAKILNVHVETDGRFFHLLSRKSIPKSTRFLIRIRPIIFARAYWLSAIRNLKRGLGKDQSLTSSDQEELIAQLPWRQ